MICRAGANACVLLTTPTFVALMFEAGLLKFGWLARFCATAMKVNRSRSRIEKVLLSVKSCLCRLAQRSRRFLGEEERGSG